MAQRGATRSFGLTGTLVASGVAALLGLAVLLAPAAHATAPPAGQSGQVVLLGIPGLRWSDLSETGTPALWKLTGQGSTGALSVRATKEHTCPTDGWLTVSAGQRARLAHGTCGLAPVPATAGESANLPGWAAIKKDNAGTPYKAQLGLLGDAVRRSRRCTMAIGAGAVFGAADSGGRVDVYAPTPDKVPSGGWSRCPLTAVEFDDLYRAYVTAGVTAHGAQAPVSPEKRAAAVTAADRRLSEVLTALPPSATVLVAGLADTGTVSHLHVAIAKGAGFGPAYLTSNATRQSGLITLTDITATALKLLGLRQPKEAVGSAWRAEPAGASAKQKAHDLDDEDAAAQAIRRVQTGYFIVLFGGQLLLYGLATVALRRRWGSRSKDTGERDDDGVRRRILSGTRLIALVGAAAPVASFLANVVPWWRSSHPVAALILSVLGWIAVITALALAGPWRRSLTGAGLVIAGITALVLGLDVVTGSRLELNGLMGYTATVGGRFYGFGNQGFALFAVAAILSAAWLAERPLRAGRRRAAVALVALAGVVAVALDGWPAWGSDFGGVIAMVPALAVLGLLIAGQRVSVLKVGLFCLAGAVLVLAIAYADSLRAEPSHLGKFWDDLMAGEAWGVIARKAGAMLRSLGYWPFTVAVIGALGFLFFVLARPLQWRAALLDRAYHHSPTLRPALIAALTLAISGMLVNDSGVVIPAIAFSLAIPLTLAASVRALELDQGEAGGAPSPPATPAQRSTATG